MGIFLYDLVLLILHALIRVASFYHPKAKSFVNGRKNFFTSFQKAFRGNTRPIIWMHCASLGEFEQGRPVLEALKEEFPQYKILLTFFSPSGYEVRKNYPLADYIFYLPRDSRSHARQFIQTAKPVLAIFVKYEFWYHYIHTLYQNRIPLICISGVFRPEQPFFKFYGKLFQKMLFCFSHIFVQNEESARLLSQLGIRPITLAGDTRFDRVYRLAHEAKPIPVAEHFKGHDRIMVIGSCWAEDLQVLIPFINDHYTCTKFIIAPHEISESLLRQIEHDLSARTIRYSAASSVENLDAYHVLLIDNIGLLARLYRYGEYAWVGGGYGKGLHNILEPACFGMPIFFGNRNYRKFPEAVDLVNRGGAFDIADYRDLNEKFRALNDPGNYLLACQITRLYVEEKRGATETILKYCRKLLTP